MAGWSEEELDRIGSADELRISSRRPDGTLRKFITIWAVRSGGDVYVRSAFGPENGWFVRATRSGEGRIRAGGVERDVSFERPDPSVDAVLDAAYHAKYDGGWLAVAPARRLDLPPVPARDGLTGRPGLVSSPPVDPTRWPGGRAGPR